MKNRNVYIYLILIIFIFYSAGSTQSYQIIKENSSNNSASEWTILIYLDGDNNLESSAIDDFFEMSSVGSNEDINIVVQFDRTYGYSYAYGDWETTKRYLVTKSMKPTSEAALMDIGEANMGDPNTLTEFANWGIENYPADKYCLILWDHGHGWNKEGNDFRKDICDDSTDGDALTLSELRNSLYDITSLNGIKFDLIGFDACLMGMIEVAYEIEDYGKFMTASEETEPHTGWDYYYSLLALKNNPKFNGAELGGLFVEYYEGYEITLSTISLNLDTLIEKINIFADSLRQDMFRPNIATICENVETYQVIDNVDLYDLAFLCTDIINDPVVMSYAYDIMNEVSDVVVNEKHDHLKVDSHGIAIYFPYYNYDYDYSNILFSIESNWDEFLEWYFESPESEPPTNPVIEGTQSGSAHEFYEFSFFSIDPEASDVYYLIGWGDEKNVKLYGPKKSGEHLYLTHVWAEEGSYVIKAKALDLQGGSSDWETYPVSMPKLKNYNLFEGNFLKNNQFFNKILNNFFNIF